MEQFTLMALIRLLVQELVMKFGIALSGCTMKYSLCFVLYWHGRREEDAVRILNNLNIYKMLHESTVAVCYFCDPKTKWKQKINKKFIWPMAEFRTISSVKNLVKYARSEAHTNKKRWQQNKHSASERVPAFHIACIANWSALLTFDIFDGALCAARLSEIQCVT